MSVQTIQSIMMKLTIMHQSLLKLETRKTALITEGNIDELNKVINDEQTHISAIAQLEGQRQQAVNVFFRSQQVAGVEPTMNELLARVSNEADKQQLAKARADLLEVVTQLKEKNDLNQSLLYNSLQVVNMTLDLVRPQEANFNYGNEQGARSTASKGRFDSQA